MKCLGKVFWDGLIFFLFRLIWRMLRGIRYDTVNQGGAKFGNGLYFWDDRLLYCGLVDGKSTSTKFVGSDIQSLGNLWLLLLLACIFFLNYFQKQISTYNLY